jgi:hypothetical protein
MTRELKFKAWDKFKKEWVNFLRFGLNNENEPISCYGVSKLDFELLPEDGQNWIWVQSTGLHAKKNKEIYFDSSILEYGGAIFVLHLYDEEYGFIVPHIEWIKGSKDWSYSEFAYDKSGDCIIIGNIYENPELLVGE